MMRTLLCTAPSSSTTTSPIDTSPPTGIAPPPNSGGSSSSAGASSSPTSSRKFNLLGNPVRRPSIRKRIQSLSRASGASLDKATATLSNAAGSKFSFFRHASGSFSTSSSAGNANTNASGTGSGSGSAHTRGASTSSSASGRSKSSSSSGHGHGRNRLNVLNIGPPSAFKHQFHIGPDSCASDEPWDESRWRQVIEMRGNGNGLDQNDTPVIDVVPPTASIVLAEPRASTSSESNVSHSHSRSQSHSGASLSSPNLLSIATAISTSNPNPSSSSTSPASASTSVATPSTVANELKDEAGLTDKPKTPKQVKRASLVKRKPVPQINPEDLEPVPNAAGPSSATNSPVPTTFVLMPDPGPSRIQAKAPETAPAGKTSFDLPKTEEVKDVIPAASLRKEEPSTETTKKAEVKDERPQESTHAPALPSFAPTHICVLHSSPAPTPPPRRHTLAHMQARALGRGLGVGDAPSIPSGPRAPTATTTPETQTQAPMLERKRSKARPMPFVAPSPAIIESVASASAEEKGATSTEKLKETPEATKVEEQRPDPSVAAVDSSPRPSLASLASASSSSEGSETARSASCGSSSESGVLELEMEPRTPTDERRVSAGSAASIKHLNKPRNKEVRIVLPGDFPATDDEEIVGVDERDVEVVTPRTLRRASKRPNPPARRVEANEESVYVTADEADDV